MLEPSRRVLLRNLLAPPIGFQFDQAIICTYSLDLLALAGASLSLFGLEPEAEGVRDEADSLLMIQTAQRVKGRISVYCQAGAIHLPSAFRDVFLWLESSIIEVTPLSRRKGQAQGVFHPKLWFLRFVGARQAIRYRVIVASRNLTYDRCWDAVACLDGEVRSGQNGYRKNQSLSRFVESLSDDRTISCSQPQAPEHRDRATSMAGEIYRTNFSAPAEGAEWTFWPLGLERREVKVTNLFDGKEGPFAGFAAQARQSAGRRLAVVAPFVDRAVVSALDGVARDGAGRKGIDTLLVSRAEALDQVAGDIPVSWTDRQQIPQVWAFLDDGSLGDATAPGPAVDDAPALRGLHAKLWVADDGHDGVVWMGSANATAAAFERNIECLLEVRGKKSLFGIDATLGRQDAAKAEGLFLLLEPYRRPKVSAVDTGMLATERQLSFALMALCGGERLRADAGCDESGRWWLQLALVGAVDSGFEVTAIPMTTRHLAAPAWKTAGQWRFEGLEVAQLTEFWALEIRDPAGRVPSRSALVRAPASGLPGFEVRRQATLRRHLGDAEKLGQYLELLLAVEPESLRQVLRKLRRQGAARRAGRQSAGQPLFESLLEALSAPDDVFRHLAEVLTEAGDVASAGMSDVGDMELNQVRALWNTVKEARERLACGQGDRA